MSNQAYPFRTAAARHRKSLTKTVQWQTGQRVTVPLDAIGYSNELHLLLALTVTVGTTGTVTDADQAASNFLPFIGLRSPQGEQVWSTNSRDMFDFNYRLERSVTPSSDPNYANFSASSATAQPVNLRLRCPIAINEGDNFDFGMIQRQISNNQFFLDLQMANLTSDLQGNGTVLLSSITGNIYVEEVWYDALAEGAAINGVPVAPPDFTQYVRLRSITSPALVNGQNDVRYDCGPVIMDAWHRIINNSAADANNNNVTQIQLQANKGNEIENRTGNRVAFDNTMHLGKKYRNGVYHLDFCDDVGKVNQTKGRDFINSSLASQLDFNIQYAGTPSGQSTIQSFYREIVTLSQ